MFQKASQHCKLERGETVDVILLDMSRAFDRVSHYKLIKRLKRCGYKGKLLQFIHNMLNNRSQKVYANGVLSEPLPVLSGTPQGAALSPILFTIFMGEVGDIIEEQLKEEDQGKDVIRSREDAGLWTLMFADDTKAAGSMKSNDQMELIQAVLGCF